MLAIIIGFICQICFAEGSEKILNQKQTETVPGRSVGQLEELKGVKESVIAQKQLFEEEPPISIPKPIPLPGEEKDPYIPIIPVPFPIPEGGEKLPEDLDLIQKEDDVFLPDTGDKVDPSKLNRIEGPPFLRHPQRRVKFNSGRFNRYWYRPKMRHEKFRGWDAVTNSFEYVKKVKVHYGTVE